MSEANITEIKTLNGYPLADTKARADIATLSEEKVDKQQGVKNARMILYVGQDGNTSLMQAGEEITIGVSQAGKNIFHGEWQPGRYVNGMWEDMSSSPASKNVGVMQKFPVIPGAMYTMSHKQKFAVEAYLYVIEYDANGGYVSQINYAATMNSHLSRSFKVSASTHYISVYIFGQSDGDWHNIVPADFMIEMGETATAYEPYRESETLELDAQKAYDKMAEAGLLQKRHIVPPYYFASEYLQTKCNRIRNLLDGCAGDGDAFMFITDQHWELNAKQSPALLNYIAKNVHIPRLFAGGDTADTTHEQYAKVLPDAFAGTIHYCPGNHDYMSDMNGNKLAYLWDMGKREQIGNAKRHYYYVDNPQQSIRYIVLCAYSNDTGALTTAYDTEQINWLRDVALHVETGWTVLVITHCLYACGDTAASFAPSPEGASEIVTLLDSAACEIACVIQGHLHLDRIGHTPGGIPVVATTCDKYKPWIKEGVDMEPHLSTRVAGTKTEQAFDVVVLDKAARKLTFVRIGAPADNWTDGVSTGTVEERVVTY